MSATAAMLTLSEAADTLRVSLQTVRRMVDSGELEARRLSPQVIRIPEHALATVGQHVAADRRRHIVASQIETFVVDALASAPPLTDAQVERIAGILRGGAQ